ncbi:MAG TPA: cupin domain-containing protein [Blastocatellia bacterium]|nr:cupin domain-containing protein [Blastocatellia bacterium]
MNQFKHFKWDEIPAERINEKFVRKLAWDGKVMISWMECKKGCHVPAHSHENEQLTFVISGRWRFQLDGKTLDIGPNEMLYIPPNAVHAADALEDLVAYDIFVPPREDWISGDDAYLRDVKYESPGE